MHYGSIENKLNNMNTQISEFAFTKKTEQTLSSRTYGTNWPIVYILENEREAYVGETTSALRRIHDHLVNPIRNRFSRLYVIEDPEFNESATLDIESKLIEYMHADKKYTLQNSNGGLRNHNYYNKKHYKKSKNWACTTSNFFKRYC